MTRPAHLLLPAALLVLVLAPRAEAHAGLVKSLPAAGARLLDRPQAVVLEYNEDLDPEATRVELRDSSGRVVVAGPGTADRASRRILRLEIGGLVDGAYAAVWRARSAVDGHVTEGWVGFSVGASAGPASLLPPPGTPDPATVFPPLVDVLARWLCYLAAAVGLGSVAFAGLARRTSHRSADPGVDRLIISDVLRLSLIGLIALAAATVVFAAVQAIQAFDRASGPGVALLQFSRTRTGRLLALRLASVGALYWLVSRRTGPGLLRFWWPAVGLVAGTLLTFSLHGHGAARGSLAQTTAGWLHLAAMTAWLGGLAPLFAAVRRGGTSAAPLVRRFSLVAIVSVGVLALTGSFNASRSVLSWEALVSTTFGRALVVKICLFGVLLALGAVNLLVLSPRLRRDTSGPSKAPGWLKTTLAMEMVLGLLLLATVSVLTGVAPASEALQSRQQQGFVESAQVEGVRLQMRVSPGRAGDNEIGVEISDSRRGAAATPARVVVRLTMSSLPTGTQELEAVTTDGRRYTARGSYFAMSGMWRADLIIRRSGFEDVRRGFNIQIR